MPGRSNEMGDVPVPAPGALLGDPMMIVMCWLMWLMSGFVAGSYIPAMPPTEGVCQGLQRPPRRLPRRGKKIHEMVVGAMYGVVTPGAANGDRADGRPL